MPAAASTRREEPAYAFRGFDGVDPPPAVPEEEREICVGTIELQVPIASTPSASSSGPPPNPVQKGWKRYNPPMPKSAERERRDVFVCPAKFHGNPYYVTQTNNRVLVVDHDKISYFPGLDPATRRAEAKRAAEEAQAHLEEMERRRREAAECAHQEKLRPKHAAVIGTIVVQDAVPRGGLHVPPKQVRTVYVSPEALTDTTLEEAAAAAAQEAAKAAEKAAAETAAAIERAKKNRKEKKRQTPAPARRSRSPTPPPTAFRPYFLVEGTEKKVYVKDLSQIRYRRLESAEERWQREQREREAMGEYANIIGTYDPGDAPAGS